MWWDAPQSAKPVKPLLAAGAVVVVSAAVFWNLDRPNPKRAVALRESVTPQAVASGLDSRFALWRQGLKVAAAYPIFGYGAGQLLDALALARRPHDPEARLRHRDVHQDFIQTAAESGWPALILYLALLARGGVLMARSIRGHPRGSPERALRFALAAGAIAFLLHGFVDFPLSRSVPRLLAFAMIGLAAGPALVSPNDTDALKGRGTFVPAALILIFLAAAFYLGAVRETAIGYRLRDFQKARTAGNTVRAQAICLRHIGDPAARGRHAVCVPTMVRAMGSDARGFVDRLAAEQPGDYKIAEIRATFLAEHGFYPEACAEVARGRALRTTYAPWRRLVDYALKHAETPEAVAACERVRDRASE
ncbi:MAG: O-antigen ligase family protein [Deltaproteobacteria bacterium]|nr:O-antigen ligase family protein [Deltaproteobacteria bacterium]